MGLETPLTAEHGITGEVLCALDMETLMDLGVTSLGHRLSVLRAVFELKKEQGVEIGEDDWRPSGGVVSCVLTVQKRQRSRRWRLQR